jgi:hypothetical protein
MPKSLILKESETRGIIDVLGTRGVLLIRFLVLMGGDFRSNDILLVLSDEK